MYIFDSHAQKTSVRFQLSFPRASQTYTAFLTFQVSPTAHQASRHMLKLSQLHLKLTFMSTRTLSKNIEYQPRAIQYTTL